MDRRNHKRFDLEATARFSWTDATGVRWQGQGLTRDISETGVFVLTPDCPPSGVAVRLEVRASALSKSGLMMQTKGQVVRVEVIEPQAAIAGFAAATRSLKLRNCKPGVTRRGTEYGSRSLSDSKSWMGNSRKPN
jgi:PilZ domain